MKKILLLGFMALFALIDCKLLLAKNNAESTLKMQEAENQRLAEEHQRTTQERLEKDPRYSDYARKNFVVTDQYGQARITISILYSDACAERVSALATIRSARPENYALGDRTQVLKQIAGQIQKRCSIATEIMLSCSIECAGQRGTGLASDTRYVHLRKSADWEVASKGSLFDPYMRADVAAFLAGQRGQRGAGKSLLKGALLLSGSHQFEGVMLIGNVVGMPAVFSGRFVQEPVDINDLVMKGVRVYLPVFIARGQWFSFGDSNNKCKASKNGYAHWGTLKIRAASSSSIELQECNGEGHPTEKERPSYFVAEWNGISSRKPYTNQQATQRDFYARFDPPLGVGINVDQHKNAAEIKARKESAKDAARSRIE